jgi:fructokinase
MDLICLGELLVDMAPAELGRSLADVSAFFPKPGGAPANVAVAAARIGAKTAFIGKVGDDPFGRHLADVLRQNGVDISGLCYDKQARTSMAFFAKPDENTAEYMFYRNPGADMLLEVNDLDASFISRTRALHIGSITLIQEPSRSATIKAVELAKNSGALLSFDVNYRPSLWEGPQTAREGIIAMIPQADILKVNDVELELLTGTKDIEQGSLALLHLGPELVVITLGPGGSYFRCKTGSKFVAGFQVQAVDAVGCGDAFLAGLLVKLLSEKNWHQALTVDRLGEILRYGNAMGALTATKAGVIPSLPTAKQVEEFLNNQ